MPAVSRLDDVGSGHASFPPTNVIAGSGNCKVNSKPVARVGDALQPHGSPSPSPPHPRSIASGSSNVSVNSKPLSHIGSAVDCGGLLQTGSGNTDVN